MQVIIPEPSKEALEKNGWEYMPNLQLYRKIFNECSVCIQKPDIEFPYICWIPPLGRPTPDDLIAIANELKKLETEE
jgi:hypothetical protein